MGDETLVMSPDIEASQRLLALLDRGPLRPRAAVWVYGSDTGRWKLWIVPDAQFSDKHAFYRRMADALAELDEPDLAISDVSFTAADHPAIRGLSRILRVEGVSNVRFTSNMLNGYYLPDAIVIRIAV